MIRPLNEDSESRRPYRVGKCLRTLLGALLVVQSSVKGGSIFDDNWTPPAPAKPATSPVNLPENKPAPTPEPAKLDTTPKSAPVVTPSLSAPAVTNAPPARRAIPAPADQAKSRKLFKELFAKELADHSAPARRALAAKLLSQAASVVDVPTDEFVLLAAATDAGKEGSDLGVLCKAADAMADAYDVDGLRLKIDRATKMTLRADSPAVAADNCRAGLKLVDQLVAEEDFLTAGRILQSLHAAAPDVTLRSEISARIKDVDTLRTAAAHVLAQLQKLKTSPDDPVANLAAGKYYCFVKDDWNTGLPFLTKGGDAALKALAQEELSTPSDALAKMGLADKWVALAAKTQGTAQARMQRRAVEWYDEALPSLTGLEKVAVERKRGALMATLTGLNGHRMTPEEIAARFTFPNNTFQINGDAISAQAGDCDHLTEYVWLEHAEKMQSLEFGFDIKAKWYHIAAVEIDGKTYGFSRGHWNNDISKMWVQRYSEEKIPGTVASPNDWASFKVVVEQDKVTYSYNGVVVGSLNVMPPMTKSSSVRVGFSSHHTQFSVKNVYILER